MTQQIPTRPTLTVDLLAIAENFRRLQAQVSPAEVAAVVKADAYGLGARPVARTLLAAGCKAFFVAHAEEGADLRPVLPGATIFVLNGFAASQAPLFQSQHLSPVISSLSQLDAWQRSGLDIPYALHADTGMSRLGLSDDELASVEGIVRPALVMSHLACADDPLHTRNREQMIRFKSIARRFPTAWSSLSASGGCFLGQEYRFDLVRPGIALYGGNPWKSGENPMRGTIRLAAPLLQVRSIDRGDTVGYGASYVASGPRRLGIAAMGYADGLLRTLSNRGHGVVGGVKCPIVGRVSMDLVTLDISECPEHLAQPGAMVEFIGPGQCIDDVARAAGTVAYEILTRLGTRVVRQYTGAP